MLNPVAETARLLMFAALRQGRLRVEGFNPEQARDEFGRWINEGGFLSSPSDAIISLHNNQHTTVAAEDVRLVLKKAADKGAGPMDLTNLTIEGTPIFAGGLNRARDKMPQIPKEQQKKFLKELKDEGIGVQYDNARPAKLLPTQKEIDAVRVGQKLADYDKGKKDLREIMVSKDDYVLDGHHRWAVMATLDAENPREKITMPVIRILQNHTEALNSMLRFNKKHGIKAEALEERALGGPGSGNFGHEGRPGEIGGSGGGSESAKDWPIDDNTVRKKGVEYPEHVARAYDMWADELNTDQRDAINNYTDLGFIRINEALRSRNTEDVESLDKADLIQHALLEAPFPPPPELVWRGFESFPSNWQAPGTGDVIELRGFQSTTINPQEAQSWGRKSKLVFEIKPKAGAFIKSISQNPGEEEFLLPHKARYKVRGVTTVQIGSNYKSYNPEPVQVIQLEMQ